MNASKWMIKMAAAVVVMGATTTMTQAAPINALNTAITQNFNGMGSTTTLPSGWVTTNKTAAAGSVDAVATTLSSSSGGQSYAFSSGSDVAIGFLNSGSFGTPTSIQISFTNNTASTITQLNVAFDYEKYRSGTRAWTWTLASGTTAATPDVQTFGGHAYAADAANTTTSFPPLVTSKSGSITGLTLAPGNSYFFKWTLQGSGGSSNGQALGIDNFSLTAIGSAAPVPEPASLGLLGVGAMGLLARRRKSSR